jgi:hypothetical protein
MNIEWEYKNFKTDYRNRTSQFYCGLKATRDDGSSVLLEAAIALGEDQKKLESAWPEEEINQLLDGVRNSSFPDEEIISRFEQEELDTNEVKNT